MYQINDITGWTWVITQSLPDYEYRNEKPLYIHPAKELTLTDEDILEEWTCKYSDCYQDTLIKFAKAIMKRCGIISGTDK